MRVLITDHDLGDPEREAGWLREELGAEVRIAQCRDARELAAVAGGFDPDALIVQWAPVTRDVIAAIPHCRIISRIGIGVDMIDVEAATAAGIEVRNVPHYCTEEVASHAVTLAMTLLRRIPQLDAELRAGAWAAASSAPAIRRLSDLTVGLIGYGRIAHLVAEAFAVWGATIIVHDPYLADAVRERVGLDELLGRSDLISIHAPLTPETHHLIDGRALAAMARRPVLVNTSRGPIIDTAALPGAVAEGHVSGLGLDVYESEPLPADSPLRTLENTVLTPHAAWCSDRALPALRRGAVDNVVTYFQEREEKR